MTRNQLIAAAQALYKMDGMARRAMLLATATKYLRAEALEYLRARKAGENPSLPALQDLLTGDGQELVSRIGNNAIRLLLASPRLRQLGDEVMTLVVELLAPLPQPAVVPVVGSPRTQSFDYGKVG